MHEYSLAEALLNQLDRLRQEHGATRVLVARVEVGEFSGIEPELLQSAFSILAEASPLRGAQLALERVPLAARCEACGHEFKVERCHFRCGKCGSARLALLRGEHLLLREVTLEGIGGSHE